MELQQRVTPGAKVQPIEGGWRLSIPAGGANRYRLAQLDNCTRVARKSFPYYAMEMRLRARVSAPSLPGTWGFGVWNDPYRVDPGPGENILHWLTLPNAAWFFYSSPASHLSFRDDKPANGFLAQTFRSRSVPLLPLLRVAATFIFSRARARRMLSRLIDEEAVALKIDVTQWHEYRVQWSEERAVFGLDGTVVLETDISPKAPLAAILWIDNQFAAFTPRGKVAFGVMENGEAWLDLEDLKIIA